ncbi:hypothetical protein GS489_05420 [Rhodococcus hoagii]|nr:hypothetical protein [Prescottella equi]MBM4569932.1 hypothetical protein [Prescottella equi]
MVSAWIHAWDPDLGPDDIVEWAEGLAYEVAAGEQGLCWEPLTDTLITAPDASAIDAGARLRAAIARYAGIDR